MNRFGPHPRGVPHLISSGPVCSPCHDLVASGFGDAHLAIERREKGELSYTSQGYQRPSVSDDDHASLDPIRKGFRMGVFRVRSSEFRRGSGREGLLSGHFRGQRSRVNLFFTGR